MEVIGGLKHAPSKDDYNVTTNLRYWGLDKRFTAYTWFGTINGPEGGPNEWESVNSVQWKTRTFHAGLWNHFKSELYNPNVVGHNTLSNEVILTGWLEWSRFKDQGVVRKFTATAAFDRYDLYTARGNDYTRFTTIVVADFVAPAGLGLWHGEVNYQPGTKELFRYRDPGAEPTLDRHRDSFGTFVLVEQHRASGSALFRTDPSRRFAGSVAWKRGGSRGASSTEVEAELTLKSGSRSLLSGSIGTIDVGNSPHQSSYSKTLQRAKVEHTFANDLNVRLIYETNHVRERTVTSRPRLNLLVSWPVTSSTTIYLLSDQTRETVEGGVPEIGVDTRSVAVKVSHTLTGRW